MAQTLKENRPVRGIEAIAERPDGTRICVLPYPTPLHDTSGRLTGAVNLLMDITDRHRSDVESAQLATIVASSDDAIVSKTLEGVITSWNAGAHNGTTQTNDRPIDHAHHPPTCTGKSKVLARLQKGAGIDHTKQPASLRTAGASIFRRSPCGQGGRWSAPRRSPATSPERKFGKLAAPARRGAESPRRTPWRPCRRSCQSLRAKNPNDFVPALPAGFRLAAAHAVLTQTTMQSEAPACAIFSCSAFPMTIVFHARGRCFCSMSKRR